MTDAVGLVSSLSRRGVTLVIRGDRVDFDAPAGAIADADIAAMRQDKPAVIAAIRRLCGGHLDVTDWIDAPHPDRPGWIRTTCRRCGKWLGNRPSGC